MSDKRNAKAAQGWELFELVDRPATVKRLAIAHVIAGATPGDVNAVHHEMRILRAAGMPADLSLGHPNLELLTGKCSGEHGKTKFWVLKCKPSPFRIYFFVQDPAAKVAVALLTVVKKKNPRDSNDFDVCCSLLEKLRSRTAKAARIDWLL